MWLDIGSTLPDSSQLRNGRWTRHDNSARPVHAPDARRKDDNVEHTIRDAPPLDEFCWRAVGDVLINGLGLGIAVQSALAKPEVCTATVIEISEDS